MIRTIRFIITPSPKIFTTSTTPGIAIAMAALGFNLFGDALRDTIDPRGRR